MNEKSIAEVSLNRLKFLSVEELLYWLMVCKNSAETPETTLAAGAQVQKSESKNRGPG